MPMSRRSGGMNARSSERTRPSTTIDPLSGSMRPATMRRVVVLPHPLGPSKETMVPLGTSSDRSLTTALEPYDLLSRSIRSPANWSVARPGPLAVLTPNPVFAGLAPGFHRLGELGLELDPLGRHRDVVHREGVDVAEAGAVRQALRSGRPSGADRRGPDGVRRVVRSATTHRMAAPGQPASFRKPDRRSLGQRFIPVMRRSTRRRTVG